jgi:sulfatase modifying factor 1
MTVADAPDLARIAPGEFLMGASDAAEDERPVHQVYVSEFMIGRFPVTNDEFARFVRATGYPAPAVRTVPLVAAGDRETDFKDIAAEYAWKERQPPAGRGAHPVVLVRFDDAVAYCRWLSGALERRVRLPTEAEWEKAARGGLAGNKYPWGNELAASNCNYLDDHALKRQRGTRASGTYPPNAYGLCDMAGNVWEWVSDWYDPDYYAVADSRDPRGPETGTMRIVRGGSWVTGDPSMLRCAYRHKVPPDTYSYSIGFRIVCAA